MFERGFSLVPQHQTPEPDVSAVLLSVLRIAISFHDSNRSDKRLKARRHGKRDMTIQPRRGLNVEAFADEAQRVESRYARPTGCPRHSWRVEDMLERVGIDVLADEAVVV